MVQFRDVLEEVLRRLRRTRAAAFLSCQSPPTAPAPVGPRSPGWPQKPPIRLPPLPPTSPPPALPPPVIASGPASAQIYPREGNTWGLDGGFVPTTTGFETRVFEPPRQKPKVQPLAFSVFDDLFDN